jgi:hypothetical protein
MESTEKQGVVIESVEMLVLLIDEKQFYDIYVLYLKNLIL